MIKQIDDLKEAGNKRWYAVYTRNRHEKIVNSQLNKMGIETFLPLREHVSQWKDRKKRIQSPLFPGYLFTYINLKEDFIKLVSSRGLVRILGTNGKPEVIPEEEIDSLRTVVNGIYKYDPYPYLREGTKVVVTREPLEGTVGSIVERFGKHKLRVSIELIKRSVYVDIEADDVEVLQ